MGMNSRQLFPVVISLIPMIGGSALIWGAGGAFLGVGLWGTIVGVGQAIVETIKTHQHLEAAE